MPIFGKGQQIEKPQAPSRSPLRGSSAKEKTDIHISPSLRPPKDTSFFGGKKEISRGELRENLKGFKSYEAQRSYGLNLSREERAKLEKDIFPRSKYGENISRDDFKRGVKKLKEAFGADKTPENKQEAKFLKKLGGIK